MEKIKNLFQKRRLISYERMMLKRIYRKSLFFLLSYSVCIFFLHLLGHIDTAHRGTEIFTYPMNFGGAATFGMMVFSAVVCILILLFQHLKEPILLDKALWPKRYYVFAILEGFYVSIYISAVVLFVWMFTNSINADVTWLGRLITLTLSFFVHAFYLRLLFPALIPIYARQIPHTEKEKIY